ncbi:MAG: hypothetical protein WCC04_05715 [Terriglobales bacterium]
MNDETKNEMKGDTMSPTTAATAKPAAQSGPGLTPAQQRVLDQVRALRKHTQLTGFKTSRSQSELLATLKAADLAAVVMQLNND